MRDTAGDGNMSIDGMQKVECQCGNKFMTDDAEQTLCRECLGRVAYVHNEKLVMTEADDG